MRWSIEDSISLLRFLCNQRQSSNLLADEDITRAIKIDDGVKIVMKSNLIDTAAFDDNGYRICYNLLELYDGNWLAVLGTRLLFNCLACHLLSYIFLKCCVRFY